MSIRTKNLIYSAVLIVAMIAVYQYRKRNQVPEPTRIEGMTMGTTYHITYFDPEGRDFKPEVDSLLTVFNRSLNTYLPDSEIATFNKSSRSLTFELPFFRPVLEQSRIISEASQGAFDPTVMPLVNVWGFGPGETLDADSAQIDSILQFVGMERIHFNQDSVWKDEPRVQLDFSAIAKGYGVDVVAGFIKAKGVTDLFVEIGGEVMTYGKNQKSGEPWVIGILDPHSTLDDQRFLARIKISDRAVATSGNYFNYREVEGKRFSHTIDPDSGYPIAREILSASIIAPDCMTADAWATACMVMGHEKAIALLKDQKDIQAFITYSEADGKLGTYISPGIVASVSFEGNP